MAFDKGDVVLYHNRIGIVTDLYDYLYSVEPLTKVYFFDVEAEAIIDDTLLKKASDIEVKTILLQLLSKCDCGEKHVEVPAKHSEWCAFRKAQEGKSYEILKNFGKLDLE